MAFNDALAKENLSLEDFKKHVLTIFTEINTPYYQQQGEQLEASEQPWEAFIGKMNKGYDDLAKHGVLEFTVVDNNENSYALDVSRCLYLELFKANNKLDIASIMCVFEPILANVLSKWISFDCQETLAKGNKRCTFRYSKK